MDYTIKRGDTLSGLAQRYKTTVDKLAQDNQIKNPDLIREGATLHIDSPEAAKPAAEAATKPETAKADAAKPSEAQASQSASKPETVAKPEADSQQISELASEVVRARPAEDLSEARQRAEAMQAEAAVEAEATVEPEAPAQDATAAPAAEAAEAPHKSWWDKLVDGGEKLVADTFGKIPLIGGLFKFQSQVTGGALKAAGDMVGGIFNAVAHPIQTLKGLWNLAAHIPFSPPNLLHVANQALHGKGPSEILAEEGQYLKGVWNGLTEGYQQSIKEGKYGEVPGRLLVDVGSLLIGAGEANAAAKGVAAAGKVARGTAAAGKSFKVASVGTRVAKGSALGKTAAKAAKVADAAADASRLTKTSRLARMAEKFSHSAVGKATTNVGKRLDDVAGAFRVKGANLTLREIGAVTSESAKAIGQVGVELAKATARVPKAVFEQVSALGGKVTALSERAIAAAKLGGEAAAKAYRAVATEARVMAREVGELAARTGDLTLGQLATKLTEQASHLDRVAASAHALHGIEGGRKALEE